MGAISDNLFAAGAALHCEAVHGEMVEVLDGTDAGKKYTAIREVESDQILMTELGPDARAKIVLRFRDVPGGTPNIGMSGRLKTEDGRKWNAVRRQEAGFLTNDYELTEITTKDQA